MKNVIYTKEGMNNMTESMLIEAIGRVVCLIDSDIEKNENIESLKTEELTSCVLTHAAAVAVSGMAAGILPVAGSVAALGICVAANWRMYIKMCEIINVPFGKKKLKAISSAVVSNIMGNIALFIGLQMATSVVPGAGIVTEGVLTFFVTYFSAIVFLNMLTKVLGEKRKDIENMTDEEFKKYIKEEVSKSSKKKKDIYKECKNVFTKMYNDGSLDKTGKETDISDEEI